MNLRNDLLTDEDIKDLLNIIDQAVIKGHQAQRIIDLKKTLSLLYNARGPKASGKFDNNA